VATVSPAIDVQSMVSGAIEQTVVDLDQGNSRAQLTKTRTLEINCPVHQAGLVSPSCGFRPIVNTRIGAT
jgi:hypothetical protein